MGRASKRKRPQKTFAPEDAPEPSIMSKGALPSWSGSATFHLVLLVVVGLLVYSNTFNVPFQWDEKGFIAENTIVKDLAFFFEPSKAKELDFYDALKGRYIGYLSFALNYKLHGLNVKGYHIVNIAIHIINAALFYWLVLLTFRTPFMMESSLKEHSNHIALFSGLLFVSHPVQTEAVTYIFQRLASLMAFFYLFSLTAYIKARLSNRNASRYMLYVLALVSAVLAMKTKENAFTLPFVIAIYEFLFFAGVKRIRIFYLIPLLLTLIIIPLTLLDEDKPAGEIISGISPAARAYQEVPRWDYLFTQFRVIVTYIRLLFLPVNQNIDYDYPVFHSFFNPQVFLSFLFLLSIFSLGVYLLHRSKSMPDLRFSAFGVFWFFITLSVESSIIPIPVVINEYRIYLPSVGFFAALSTAIFLVFHRLHKTGMSFLVGSTLIIIILSGAAYARNIVWESGISLWEDAARKSPGKADTHNRLAVAYRAEGFTGKAIEHYMIALRLMPDNAGTHNNLGDIYQSEGLLDKAIAHYETAINLKPDFAVAHYNLGTAFGSKGLTFKAIEHYKATIGLKPDYANAHSNLGQTYLSIDSPDEAIEHLQTALRLVPGHITARNDLGVAFLAKGLTDKAEEQFQTVIRLKPDYAEAYYNLGFIFYNNGLTAGAIKYLQTAIGLKSDYTNAHYNLGLVYFNEGIIDKARMEFETVLKLNPHDREAKRHIDRIDKMQRQ